MAEKTALAEKIQDTSAKIDRASKLTTGLADEQVRHPIQSLFSITVLIFIRYDGWNLCNNWTQDLLILLEIPSYLLLVSHT